MHDADHNHQDGDNSADGDTNDAYYGMTMIMTMMVVLKAMMVVLIMTMMKRAMAS